jgi:metallo-beta-lactamase family protein
MSLRLHFHGAAGGVTGSCFRLETDQASLLIDCGLFQGPKTLKELNYQRFPFDPRRLDAVLLTHAHVDHSGLLPKLMLAGFRGPIHATHRTRDLCAVMLPDAGGIQEHEVDQLNRRFQRRGREPVQPIYTADDGRDCLRLFSDVRYGDWIQAAKGVRARWWDAGHILGSASIELEVEDVPGQRPVRLLFSGDLGPGGSDFVGDPEGPSGLDHLIMESTYGGTERPALSSEDRRQLLAKEVTAAHAAGGPLVIPAFAVERTQELIADLIAVMRSGAAPAGPIFLDSPLAIRATEVFLKHGWTSNGQNPFADLRSSELHTTESADESRALERVSGWHVIVAASGMCDAGRIRHHLKRLLWRPEATVMLVGYQAVGTLGRFLQQGQRHVRIQGEEIRVRATIRSLEAYSGHADGPALVAWAKARGPVSGRIFLVHGEPDNRRALQQRLVDAGVEAACIESPEMDDNFRLAADVCEAAEAPRRLSPGAAAELDWHNARSRLLLELDEAIDAAPDDAARMRLLDQLQACIPPQSRPEKPYS